MVIKCGLCERQLKISRANFVDVFYACKLEDPNQKNIGVAIVNSSAKVKRVTETNKCSNFRKKEIIKVYAMETWPIDDLTDDDL